MKKRKTIVVEIPCQCKRDQKGTPEQERTLRKDMNTLTNNIDMFASEIAKSKRINDNQADKIKGKVKRIQQSSLALLRLRVSLTGTLYSVIQLLREAMPYFEKDRVIVQRLSPTGRGQRGRFRPVFIQLSTFFYKLYKLRQSRDAPRSRGVRVSSEWRTRQMKTFNVLLEQGHMAYYRNSCLWFQDDRSDNRRGKERFYKGRFQGRLTVPDSTRSRTTQRSTLSMTITVTQKTRQICLLENVSQVGSR